MLVIELSLKLAGMHFCCVKTNVIISAGGVAVEVCPQAEVSQAEGISDPITQGVALTLVQLFLMLA